jgi:hypothetical protein
LNHLKEKPVGDYESLLEVISQHVGEIDVVNDLPRGENHRFKGTVLSPKSRFPPRSSAHSALKTPLLQEPRLLPPSPSAMA